MGPLLKEYGNAIIACVFGAIILAFIVGFLTNSYDRIYPNYSNYSHSFAEENKDEMENSGGPVIVINNELKIHRNDDNYNAIKYAGNRDSEEYKNVINNYKALATAYASATDDTVINVDVLRTEFVDVTQPGKVYPIMYKATNDRGHTTVRTVYILIN